MKGEELSAAIGDIELAQRVSPEATGKFIKAAGGPDLMQEASEAKPALTPDDPAPV